MRLCVVLPCYNEEDTLEYSIKTLGEELVAKNRSMDETAQRKMRRTLTKIVNEGKGGVICILL